MKILRITSDDHDHASISQRQDGYHRSVTSTKKNNLLILGTVCMSVRINKNWIPYSNENFNSILIFATNCNLIVNAQTEWTLRIDSSTNLVVNFLDKDEFKRIRAELTLVNSNPISNTFTREYRLNSEHSILEFFNGTAIKFEERIKPLILNKIEFARVPFSSVSDEVTFIIDIDAGFYDQLKREIKSEIEINELDFFGKFHFLTNGSVLAEWRNGFRKSEYSVLKDIKSMASIDWGLFRYLDTDTNGLNNNWRAIVENVNYERVDFTANGIDNNNLQSIKNRLSGLLNINSENLDFSIESIQEIENGLTWNCDRISKWEAFDLCYPYIGESVRRAFKLNWVEENNYLVLADENHKKLDFGFNLQSGIVHSDYGPDVMWVIEQLKIELDK